jgi:hypothetical protein
VGPNQIIAVGPNWVDKTTGLFAQVLALCVAEGLVHTGVVSIDSTKIEANASAWSNRTRQQIAEEILAEAERIDAAEDAEFGERRGGELPQCWSRRRDRRPRLAEALRQLEEQGASDWESYQAERAAKEKEAGRRLPGRKPKPEAKDGKGKRRQANTTDPDSRMLRARNRFLQGYNAQAAISEDQLIVAAEVTNAANDSTMFAPLIEATQANLADQRPVGAWAADAGYWSVPNATFDTDGQILIAPMPATQGITDPDDPRITVRNQVLDRHEDGEITIRQAAAEMGVSETWARYLRDTRRRGGPDPARVRKQMLDRMASDEGKARDATRWFTAEPAFGNIKANLGFRRFARRGQQAVQSEWRLICSIHNLLKLRAALA